MADDVETIINNAISDGKKAEVDGEKFENHSIPDIVAGLKYLDAKKAAGRANGGLRVSQVKGNSAV